MRRSGGLVLIVVAVAALAMALVTLVPLPDRWDPREDEVTPGRYAELARFAGTRTADEVAAALTLLDPQRALAPFYTLSPGTLAIRVRADGPVAVQIALRDRPADPRPPVAWPPARIALDPGHWGGAWSRAEKRQHRKGDGPLLREGDLSWATVRLLEQDLRAAGSEVRVLRGPPPSEAFSPAVDPGFDPQRERRRWMAMNVPVPGDSLSAWSALQLWRAGRRFARDNPHDLYTQHELRRRAALAESFAPDVTLSLHYNFTTQDRNGVQVFLVGNFLPDELISPGQRFWAFRHALGGSLDETRRLATAVARSLMAHFDLPGLQNEHPAWLPVDPELGVYARNLAMVRRTPGIALLVEGPCLNQTEEYPRMSGSEIEVDGRRYPARVRQYADGVLAALKGP